MNLPITLLFPLGLLALVAVPIIIWLHLRRQRHRRLVVPSLLLWQGLQHQSLTQRRWKLPFTILLLLHLLVAVLLGMALAHPQSVAKPPDKKQHIVLILDTSTSMAARDTSEGTRLDHARARAEAIINNLGVDDRAALVSAGQPAHLLTTAPASNRATLLQALGTVTTGGAGTDLTGALTLARVALEATRADPSYDRGRMLVFSDLDPPPEATTLDSRIEWERVGGDSDNRAVVAFAARPHLGAGSNRSHLYFRAANYGSSTLSNTYLRLYGDDQLLDRSLVTLKPESEIERTWTILSDVRVVRIELDGQDRMPLDDTAYLNLDQTRPVRTLLVSAQTEARESLERALGAVPELDVRVVAPDEYPTSPLTPTADLTIFESTLPPLQTWPTGGVLVVNPPVGNHPLLPVTAAQPAPGPLRISEAAKDLLEGLSLGSVEFGPLARVQPLPPELTTALSLREESGEGPVILVGEQPGRSKIAVWTFDLARSNLTTRLVFPLLVARTVRSLVPPPLPEALTLGEPLVLSPAPHADVIEVRHSDGSPPQRYPLEPGTDSLRLDRLDRPGLYTIIEQHQGKTRYEGHIAVNAGSPQESDLRPRPASIGPALPLVSPAPAEPHAQAGSPIQEDLHPVWSWLAIAALVILMGEWIYVTGRTSARPGKK
jgi:Ca-activated chloride channel homolog